MNITPGIVLADGEEITTEKLNLLGTPTVALDDGDTTTLAEGLEDLLAVSRRNYFTNPGLDQWTRGTGPVTCATGARQELANDWWVRCNATTSGSPTYSRVTSPNGAWIYAAKIAGATGVGSCDFGQDIAPHVAAALSPKITVTFDIFNGTGSPVTPEVRLDTCDTSESYGTVTHRVSVPAGGAVANNALETVTVTLDTSAYQAQLRNGAQLYIRIPSPALASASAYVHLHAPKVEIGQTATQRYVEREQTPVVGSSGTSGGATGGWLRNGDFSRWLKANVTCTEDVDNYAAEGWAVNPADGSELIYAQSTSTPGTAALYSAELTGDSSVTAQVDFAQNIPAVVAANMRRALVFSAYIYNGTGEDFQPVLRVNTCDTANDFTSTTNRASTTASTCPAGEWTRVEMAFDGETMTNIANGARLIVRFPGGVLDVDTKKVRVAQADLTPGTSAATWSVAPVVDAPAVRAGASGLLILSLAVKAEEAVLVEPGGSAIRVLDLEVAISEGGSGAGGLDTGTIAANKAYDVWLISTGRVHAGLLCLSGDAPVMPAGYRYKARVGAVWTDGSGQVTTATQRGSLVTCAPVQLFSGTVTTAGVAQAVSVAGIVPEHATSMLVEVRVETSGQPMRCTIGDQDLAMGASASAVNGAYATARVELPPGSISFKAESNTVTYKIRLLGFRLE